MQNRTIVKDVIEIAMLCKNEIMMSIFRRLSTNPAEKLIFRKRKTSTSTHIQVVFRLTFYRNVF